MSNHFTHGPKEFSHEISPQARQAFTHALTGIDAVLYEPIAVSTENNQGTNYAFLCNAIQVTPHSSPYPAMVSVFEDLNGRVGLTQIEKLSF